MTTLSFCLVQKGFVPNLLSNQTEMTINNNIHEALSSDAQRALGEDFIWGVATSAYQIEGATLEGGRGESIWDVFARVPGKVLNGDSGRHACDHYNRWQEDLGLIKDLGVDAYRFSIAWPRVQPLGLGAFNQEGLDFYDRLVDGMLERGLQPHATLYHWDLPQNLQEQGGWAARSTAQHFASYAETMGKLLGDRLSSLATHNEPWCTATLGNTTGKFAPGFKDPKLAAQVSHHLLLSHGLALKAMRAAGVRAPLGIVLNQSSVTPASNSPEDIAKARTEYCSFVRWYMDPIFRGEYPKDPGIEHYPVIESGDMALIQAPLDFLGVNYYTRIWASASKPEVPAPKVLGESDMGWEIYPDGLRELLVDIHREYKLPPVYITENGMAWADEVRDGSVNDQQRIDYVRMHLESIAMAREAGVDVRGYFYWSLMDNFEWESGYAKRFGLIHVDYTTQKRTLKHSAHWYRSMIAQQREAAKKGAAYA
jgi:beta-glucosidase